jgi:hypothetical protein
LSKIDSIIGRERRPADELFRSRDRERNRQIADNEAERQIVGAARVSIWAIAVAVIVGVICVGLVWMWLSR